MMKYIFTLLMVCSMVMLSGQDTEHFGVSKEDRIYNARLLYSAQLNSERARGFFYTSFGIGVVNFSATMVSEDYASTKAPLIAGVGSGWFFGLSFHFLLNSNKKMSQIIIR